MPEYVHGEYLQGKNAPTMKNVDTPCNALMEPVFSMVLAEAVEELEAAREELEDHNKFTHISGSTELWGRWR